MKVLHKVGLAIVVICILLAIVIQVAYAQDETPPDVDDIMESPGTALDWIVNNGGAAILAGAAVSIICWMSPKFNALPTEKKRLIANLAAAIVSVVAQVGISLLAYNPEWVFAIDNIWQWIVYAVKGLIALNGFYLGLVRQKPAVIMAPVQ